MSHGHERKQKDCLNCGTTVMGRYCQVCGQENIEPKETFGSMFMHFFSDITHFDGKFFTSLKDLLWRPGFLSAEYIRGRRMSYLNPVRMYVFTSAIFFLVFFGFNRPQEVFKVNDEKLSKNSREHLIRQLQRQLSHDSTNIELKTGIALLEDSTRELHQSDIERYTDNTTVLSAIGGEYKSTEAYDSIQHALPADQRDGWLTRLWNKRAITLNQKYRHQGRESMQQLSEIFLHHLPYLLFISLPFFALILKLIYIRRKQFFYADHAIFTIHHYVFSFILLLFAMLFGWLKDHTGWSIWGWILFLVVIAWPIYLFIAMRRFYRQGRFKTFLKFCILNILGLVVLLLLFAVFGLFSVFQL